MNTVNYDSKGRLVVTRKANKGFVFSMVHAQLILAVCLITGIVMVLGSM